MPHELQSSIKPFYSNRHIIKLLLLLLYKKNYITNLYIRSEMLGSWEDFQNSNFL